MQGNGGTVEVGCYNRQASVVVLWGGGYKNVNNRGDIILIVEELKGVGGVVDCSLIVGSGKWWQ